VISHRAAHSIPSTSARTVGTRIEVCTAPVRSSSVLPIAVPGDERRGQGKASCAAARVTVVWAAQQTAACPRRGRVGCPPPCWRDLLDAASDDQYWHSGNNWRLLVDAVVSGAPAAGLPMVRCNSTAIGTRKSPSQRRRDQVPSVEPLQVGCRQGPAQPVIEPTRLRVAWGLWSDLPAPWNPTAADPGLLPPIQ
jgi:hypothetical protein